MDEGIVPTRLGMLVRERNFRKGRLVNMEGGIGTDLGRLRS